MMATIPFDLYHQICRYIISNQDLISLSAVSSRWQIEAERILWQAVTLHYDDQDDENIRKMDFLISRGSSYVRHLDIDYAYPVNSYRNDTIERSRSFLKAIRAISRMNRLEQIDIYCNGDMAAILLSPQPPAPAFPSFESVHTVKYLGNCSPSLYRFLRSCLNLRYLRFSSNLEPTADYSLLYSHQPSEQVGVWNALTTFSGNVLHVAAILRSPTASKRIKNITIHLQPRVVTIRDGFSGLSAAVGVESLGLGDLTGYSPIMLDHVLRDLAEALKYFPNVRKVQRAPYYERMNRQHLLDTLSVIPGLRYLSVLDYENNFEPARGLRVAKELKERTAMDLETVVCIPCPNGPMAVQFQHGEGHVSHTECTSAITESTIINGDWFGEWIDLDEDSDL